MSDKVTVVSVVREVLASVIGKNVVTDEMIATLESRLKLVSVKRGKVLVSRTDVEVGTLKLAPQAKILADALAGSESPVTIEQWGALAETYGLKTNQTPARIAAYYRKPLVDAGLVAEIEDTIEA